MKDKAAREQDRIKARELKDGANNVLKADSIAEYTGFLESSPLVEHLHGEYTMDIFAFEPLHNLHLGISKQLKRCIYDRMLHNRHRTIILNACNDLLALYQKDSYVKELQFNYMSSKKGKRVNGTMTNDGIRGMLEGKIYRTIDMVFPFFAAFIDMCCEETDSCPLTKVCSQYTELMTFSLKLGYTSGWTEAELKSLQRNINHFKAIAREV